MHNHKKNMYTYTNRKSSLSLTCTMIDIIRTISKAGVKYISSIGFLIKC